MHRRGPPFPRHRLEQATDTFETHDLATRMRLFMEGGGILNVCTPCLVHRGIDNEPTLDGIVRINGRVVMEKKDRANRILSFA